MTTTILREKLIQLTGYWMYKKKLLPIGADIIVDLKEKVGIDFKNFFDVGANIGQTALLFSRNFPNATIHSFEPIKGTFKKLIENTKKNSAIKCHKLALSDIEEEIEVKVFDDDKSVLNSLKTHLQDPSQNAKLEKIQTTTLDCFVSRNEIGSIDLLKIDTEGFEIPVLNGAMESLKNHSIKSIYIEVGFSKKNVRNTYFIDAFDFLSELGYVFFGFYEIHHYDLENQNHFGNALFIHPAYIKNNNYY
jgi:FkbM family methyltransferase